jgi:hypothetical protein
VVKKMAAQEMSLEQEEKMLRMELLDELADVTTPEGSDEEEEGAENISTLTGAVPVETLQRMLRAQTTPAVTSKLYPLYQDSGYKLKAAKKIKNLKKVAKKCSQFRREEFENEIQRINRLYGEDNGRDGIKELVALHCCSGEK